MDIDGRDKVRNYLGMAAAALEDEILSNPESEELKEAMRRLREANSWAGAHYSINNPLTPTQAAEPQTPEKLDKKILEIMDRVSKAQTKLQASTEDRMRRMQANFERQMKKIGAKGSVKKTTRKVSSKTKKR